MGGANDVHLSTAGSSFTSRIQGLPQLERLAAPAFGGIQLPSTVLLLATIRKNFGIHR
jgi:hypothetical protein